MTHVDVVDVQATGGDVGGDEHRQLAVGEVGQRLLAVRLAQVAVDRRGAHAFLLEVAGQAVGAELGAR